MSNLVGTAISSYRVEALIGAGGVAQVYQAIHTVTNGIAAIKVARDELAGNAGFVNRFQSAMNTAAALSHPNVIEIYEVIPRDIGEAPAVAMEFAANGSLRTLLQQQSSGGQPLALPRALTIVKQAADGLSYAHGIGVIHGNLKPENLLLMAPAFGMGSAETVKLSDFGLAGIVEDDVLSPSAVATATLAYLSPEQCQGSTLDGRSDVYALGVVLYEAATGYLPFDIHTPHEAAQKHVSAPPLPPRQVKSDLPPTLEAVILRCLAKEPKDRYQSAAAFGEAVQGVLDDLNPATRAAPDLGPATMVPTVAPAPPKPASAPSPPPPAPRAPQAPPPRGMPRITVQDSYGQVRNTVKVTRYGMSIGRYADNVIVLTDGGIADHHVQVDWDGRQVSVTDLGSPLGTLLNGQRLAPQTATRWQEQERVQIGPYTLVWQLVDGNEPARVAAPVYTPPPPIPVYTPPVYTPPVYTPPVYTPAAFSDPPVMTTTAPIEPPQLTTTPMRAVASRRIGVALEDESRVTITPGQPVTVQVRLANLGTTVDHFHVTVEGMPPAWIRLPEGEVQLNPGKDTTVALTIVTARTPEYVAGDYPITIRSHSRERPGESEAVQTVWTILPYTDSALGVSPTLVTARWRAKYGLTVENRGNAPERFKLAGKDDERKVHYRFDTPEVDLGPGSTGAVKLTTRARINWIGRSHSRPFVVDALPAMGTAPPAARAEWVQRSLIPGWVPPVALIACILAFFAIRWYLTPEIDLTSFPPKPVVGDDMRLTWETHHADKGVDLKPVATNVARSGNQSLVVQDGQTLTLIANGYLGTKKEATVVVNAVTPTPQATLVPGQPIIKLTVAPMIVEYGQSVTVSWDVTNAEKVELTSDFHGTSVVDRKGSMTFQIFQQTKFSITATNKGVPPATDFKTVIIPPKTPVPGVPTPVPPTPVPPGSTLAPQLQAPTPAIPPIGNPPVGNNPPDNNGGANAATQAAATQGAAGTASAASGATTAAGTTAAGTAAAGTAAAGTTAASTAGAATTSAGTAAAVTATARIVGGTATVIATALAGVQTDCISYDPVQMKVLGTKPDVWLLQDRSGLLIDTFKTEGEALLAREVAQKFNRRCVIGARTTRGVTYWVATAPIPAQPPPGSALPPEDCTQYNNTNLKVVNNAIMDGDKFIVQLDNAQEAQKALTVAKLYTSVCFIGRKDARVATPVPTASPGTPTAIPPTPTANRPGPTATLPPTTFSDAAFMYWK